ncbi:hypothetical protein Salpa_2179 [Sporomusa sp. KB1]|jgi:hypothetical protein|nr:hypothetical protein Salpa_2179 [Sporomusa sp. KB1]
MLYYFTIVALVLLTVITITGYALIYLDERKND